MTKVKPVNIKGNEIGLQGWNLGGDTEMRLIDAVKYELVELLKLSAQNISGYFAAKYFSDDGIGGPPRDIDVIYIKLPGLSDNQKIDYDLFFELSLKSLVDDLIEDIELFDDAPVTDECHVALQVASHLESLGRKLRDTVSKYNELD